MDLQSFIKRRPYLFHLTDRSNLPLILESKQLFSTQHLVGNSTLSPEEQVDFLRSKRSGHKKITINGNEISIRDQDPISMKALAKAIDVGSTPNDFLEILNERVFFWPTVKDLKIHFERYKQEQPIILMLETEKIVEINSEPEFCHLNSGAPRCSPYHDGKPAPRNRNTFQTAENFEMTPGKVREFTILNFARLPSKVWTSESPEGPWVLT